MMRARQLLLVAVLLGSCRFAAAQGVPIEHIGAACPAYGPPDGPVGITDRSCSTFHAVAGERVLGSCTASGVFGGAAYPMSCTVLIGAADADTFAAQGTHAAYTAPRSGEYLVEAVYFGRQTFFANEEFTLLQLSLPTCTADASSLCLAGWRFRVTADWQAPDGRSGHGAAVALTDESGSFSFFDPANVELVVKVHDACAFNDKWWVFAGGLTDVQVSLTVTDTSNGTAKTYANPLGIPFEPIQDTTAIPCP